MINYCTIKETALRWGVSEQLVRRYCRQGRIANLMQEDGVWLIPEDCEKPRDGRVKEPEQVMLPPLARKILYQRIRNNHFGVYEYIQIELAYHSNRMASNRLTRNQVEEVYRTGKVSTAFEPMKVDDLVEIVNHFRCVREVVDTIAQPLTLNLIRRYHSILTTGTTAALDGNLRPGSFRTESGKLGLPPQDISRSLTDLLRTYERTPTDLNCILDLHVQFERIHPFTDYNGRTGRILLLKECLRHNITPFILPDKSRGTYNRGLQNWTEEPEILRAIAEQAQSRFLRKLELCNLMRYRRTGR